MNNIFFAKYAYTRKPEMLCKTFDCYNLNQAPTGPTLKHYLCYQPQARPSSQVGLEPEVEVGVRANV